MMALPALPALRIPMAVPRERTNQRVTIVVDGMIRPAMPAAPRTPKQVILRERRHVAGQRQGQTEHDPADRDRRPHAPAVVEPARDRREHDEAEPAEGVT